MKKIMISLFLGFSLCLSLAHGRGGITHMLIAEEAIALLPDDKLRQILLDNFDAYLVGAYYPDSGYVKGASYGEDSHWDPFIYTFADYLKEKYSDPTTENPRLVAFLFGIAAHRVSDELSHWTFYNVMKDRDFNGNYEQTHGYGDTGIDLLVTVEKNRWFSQPNVWWIPINDLLAIYHRMGKDEYTAAEILWGNSVASIAGIGERFISLPSYAYLQWKMPWTAAHYYDYPDGGILMDEQKVSEYQMNLWWRLTNPEAKPMIINTPKIVHENTAHSPSNTFAQQALKNGSVSVAATTNPDGSVELQQPVIKQEEQFQALANKLMLDLIK